MGLGTVGTGVVRLIEGHQEDFEETDWLQHCHRENTRSGQGERTQRVCTS